MIQYIYSQYLPIGLPSPYMHPEVFRKVRHIFGAYIAWEMWAITIPLVGLVLCVRQ